VPDNCTGESAGFVDKGTTKLMVFAIIIKGLSLSTYKITIQPVGLTFQKLVMALITMHLCIRKRAQRNNPNPGKTESQILRKDQNPASENRIRS
jgi:hypothetical protein